MFFALFSDTSRFGDEGGYQTIGDVFKNGGSMPSSGFSRYFPCSPLFGASLNFSTSSATAKRRKKVNPLPRQ